jgi:acyl-CoA synthetase (AMP-forming)/AMP-acid ligase II/1-acyl-sn-glycerol-3-phosphate acyltransferase/acyl carrier protein
MLRFLQFLFWQFGHFVLRLRYRVRVEGLEKLRGVAGPTLVLPNHPGYIDPPLVLSHVRISQPVRPVVTAGMYRMPVLYPFMRLVGALEVPDLTEQSRGARDRTRAMIDAVVAGLERGESFLIYPSGRARRGPEEVVGAARSAHEILERFPNATVVLVRTEGLWGSMFTYARTGTAPGLAPCLLRGVGWILANLVFFAPRRNVTMTVEVLEPVRKTSEVSQTSEVFASRGCMAGSSRDELNRFLEDWYNREGPESPVFVPYHFLLGPREFQFPDLSHGEVAGAGRIKPATIQAVNEMIEESLGRPLDAEEKQAQVTLDRIGLDSLAGMEVALAIEDRFGFRSDRVPNTLGELWALAEGLFGDAGEAAAPVPALWERPSSNDGPTAVLAETLAEALVRRAALHPDDVAVADELSGVLTYRRFVVGARLMAGLMQGLPGDAIGVMLPASVAADLTFFALHLAGKLPVMLNWTTGPANLAHAVRKLAVRRVVTSRKLIDRLGIEVAGADYVFLEDLRSQIGKFRAARTLLTSYLLPRSFARLPRQPGVDDPAVVLFTSGSESAPKAVPLSHRNLVANVRAATDALQATGSDRLLGFLPPFHSFGLTGDVLAPILAGIRVVHYPDPTSAAGLVRTAARYRATLLVATPTFLNYMLGVATADDLRSLRVIVTGAERCPEAVFARAAQLAPGAAILEGYGITECSPIVAGNRVGRTKPNTVGPPVDGVEVCVVDPDSHRSLPPNTTGMLLVRGPSVFRGYLAYEGPEPFVEVAGKRWYVTGDLVQVDDETFIHFQGRLKRFLKAGGEMISLPALEEPLERAFPATENGPQVAVEGIETATGRSILLFITRDITLREANGILAEAGLRGVMRLDGVVRLDVIPLLGTGKTNYKVLRKIVAERSAASA